MRSPELSQGYGVMEPDPARSKPRWSFARIILSVVLVLLVFAGTQAAIAVVFMLDAASTRQGFNVGDWAAGAAMDGTLLAVSTIAAAATTVPFMRLVAARCEPDPWRFLGFERTTVAALGRWLLVLAAFIAGSDTLTSALGRPVVPEFMTAIFASADPILLLAALVVAAPLTEELFFRGLVFGVLEARGVPASAVAVVTSAVWALIHVQYDWYGIATTFAMGLVLAAARVNTRSVLPCLVMHAGANAFATAQAALAP